MRPAAPEPVGASPSDAPTDAPPPHDAPTEAPFPAGTLALRVTAGPAEGTVLTVAGDELLIGRQAPGEGKLGNDIEISRRHARVTRESDGNFLIEDLGSTNGTFVNGKRVAAAQVLKPGDNLEMGDTKLTVEVPETEAPAAPIGVGAPPAVTTFAAIPEDLPPVAVEPTAEMPAAEAEPEAVAPEPEAAAPAPEPEAVAPEPEAVAPPEPEPVAPPEPDAVAPEPLAPAEPEIAVPEPAAVAPEPEPEPEPPAAPPTPILVASSGPISVRIEADQASGDLTLHLDDGESPARFVRRGGSWSVDPD